MLDELQALLEQITGRLEADDVTGAAALVAELPAAETADVFRSLSTNQRIAILRRLPAEIAAAVLAEVDERSLPGLFELLQDEEIVRLLDTLDSDDAADLVGQLEEDQADRVVRMLDRVDHQDALELSELLRYPEDSAGGVMAKEFLSMRHDQPIGAAVAALRQADDRELGSLHYAFVVDDRSRLVGRIPLLKMLLSDPQQRAEEVMEPDPVSVGVMEDQEEVANLFLRHDLLSLPVTDAAGRLVGRVTVDDAMDVLTEEATEDAARLAGSSAEEVGETSVLRISRARMPWLLLGLAGQLLAAVILSRFEESLQTRVVLTFFIPMVMATGGNTGIQTSTIVIRLLVTQEFDYFRAGRHLVRELTVSLLNGLLLGGAMAIVLLAWKGDLRVGIVIGVAIMTVVMMAATVGSVVPLVLHRLGIDPTVATGPFITTVNDILGISAYLALAHWLLQTL